MPKRWSFSRTAKGASGFFRSQDDQASSRPMSDVIYEHPAQAAQVQARDTQASQRPQQPPAAANTSRPRRDPQPGPTAAASEPRRESPASSKNVEGMYTNTLNIAALFDDATYSDIEVVSNTGGRSFHCHKLVLNLNSNLVHDYLRQNAALGTLIVNIPTEMLAVVLQFVYLQQYPDIDKVTTQAHDWAKHHDVLQGANSFGVIPLARQADMRCMVALEKITKAQEAYDAAVFLHERGQRVKVAVVKQVHQELMRGDRSVAREMHRNPIFTTSASTSQAPAPRPTPNARELQEMTMIYCNHCNTQAVYELGSARKMRCSHPQCEYAMNEEQISCWISGQDYGNLKPSVRLADRNAERNQRTPLRNDGSHYQRRR
ncbi:Putative BTB/POZ domain-containing protein [Septoria linicola]|uniref:BTB/POZ domain-containing protein n=1 Tax=Septoria linicola TaxID=215465 RepID=A0A9Q9AW14_9PEZI|nr:putative BTB/POZ domain-containing protein [Septoria linicola]USW52992.1 Putative BTB/POZ domain-containing protein [Septoria linicola]